MKIKKIWTLWFRLQVRRLRPRRIDLLDDEPNARPSDSGWMWPAAGLVDTWIRFSLDRRHQDGTTSIQPRVQGRGGEVGQGTRRGGGAGLPRPRHCRER